MLSVLITHKKIIRKAGGNFVGDGYVYGINYGDGFMNVHLSANLSSFTS